MKEAAKYLPISFPENCMLPTVGFAAMPTQLSLCAISVSSKSCATCRSSFVATSDFPARKMGSCISSLIIFAHLLPLLSRHQHHVTCTNLVHLLNFKSFGGVMIDEPKLFHHTPALYISIVVTAPDPIHFRSSKAWRSISREAS